MATQDGLPGRERIIEQLRASSRGPLKSKELSRDLHVPTDRYTDFKALLAEMESEGAVYRVKGGRYAVPDKINLAVGRLQVIRSGDAFLVTGEGKEDVFVPSGSLESAMDGDQVVVRIEGRPRGRQPVGRVIKVLERAHPRVVGTYHRSKKVAWVVPQSRKLQRDILIPPEDAGGARDGDVVVVRIGSYGDRKLNPVGEVETVLGPITDPGVDVLSIIHGAGLDPDFPDEVEAAAGEAARERPRPDAEGRTDCRDLLVFTIDPADAKDHDDALSIRALDGGAWEVGVHIADVSWYVEPGGPVDLEAFDRGTSVYLVDRVIPMLPHVLSSDVCSLRPDEDRYAVSAFITLDGDGRVREHRFERTLIRSRHRLSYEDAQGILDGTASVAPETDEALRSLAALARILRAKRQERGSLDFDLPEARVILGEAGEPIDIQRVLRLESHRLIEDFMLLANEVVARRAADGRLPIPYRIHEPPQPQRLEELREFLASFGQTLPKREIRPKDLQKVLARIEGRPEEALVSTVILRSMNRARYETENLGHFGLAAEWYCHFTSPIRRYPDLLVHRVVVRALVEGRSVPAEWGGESLEAAAQRSSERERAADEAERDSIELKKVEFMERHLGDDFVGTISGVTSFGFFVLLDDYHVEGLSHVNSLEDDYYTYREEEHSLVGERKGRRFRIGDRVRIRVARVNKEERHIDFLLLETLPPSEV